MPPTGINWRFLKKFRTLILSQVRSGKRFYIVTGGGATCRDYNYAAGKIVRVSNHDLDWLGIHSSRLNAHLLRTIFSQTAFREVIKNPTIHFPTRKKIIVAGGWKPGWSTDYVAAMIAQEYEIKTVINMSNIDYAYTKDPKRFKTARPLKDIDWKSFRKIVGNKFSPGLNAPFDPIASRNAEQLGVKVIILNGKKLKNLKNCIEDKKFKGTVIS